MTPMSDRLRLHPEAIADLAADYIEMLEAELAYYKGVHDGIYKDGTHVVVPVEKKDE